MKNFNLFQRLLVLSILLTGYQLQAQLTVDINQTPATMVQNLVGTGIEIFNATATAAPGSFGYYTSVGTEIGTSEGLVLTTGQAINAIGPNDETGLPQISGSTCLNCDQYDNGFMGSPLLTAANGGLTTWDACTIEFDIVPQGDSIRFNFTFASEEYLEWVGSSFNDVFGFFISGPGVGIDQNIALIPGTAEPVAINSVNNIDNTQYFYNNQNPLGLGVQYDGITVGLRAEIGNIQACEVYHLKLIIADGSDRLYDSAVFINQIESNPLTITTSTEGGTDFMIEGCNNGNVLFESTFLPVTDLDVNFALGGDAVFGVDYTTVPDLTPFLDLVNNYYTLVIPAGQTSISFEIIPISDGLTEGTEIVNITLVNQLCEGFEFQSSVDFEIIDELTVDITPATSTICNGQCVTLTADAITGGLSTFEWSPSSEVSDPSSLIVDVCPSATTTYTLTSTVANCVVSASATVNVTAPNLAFNVTNVTCIDGATGSIDLTVTDATAPITYEWTLNGTIVSTDEDPTGLEESTYCVTIVDAVGCTNSGCVDVIEDQVLNLVDVNFSSYSCFPISCNGACDGSITVDVVGGTGLYTYVWVDASNNVVGNAATAIDLCAGDYTVTVTDALGCEVTETYTVQEPEVLEIDVVGTIDILCNGAETGIATVTSTGGCAPYFYNWSHDADLNTPVATGLGAGVFTVTVNDVNGCASAGSVTITINQPGDPIDVIVNSVTTYPGGYNVSCPDANDGGVDITITGGTPGYFVTWFNNDTQDTFFLEDLANAPCGNYTLTVVDSNDCTFTTDIELTCVPDWQVSAITVPNACGDPNGGNGEIALSIFGSHGGPYTVTWNGPSCPCTGPTITNLNSGNYVATITDVNGCQTLLSVNVGTNDQFNITETVTDADCGGACTGSIELDLSPAVVDNISWTSTNGFASNDEDIFDLCAGTYAVTITLGTCEETFVYTVNEPTPINIDFIDIVPPICFGQNNGSVTADASGGTGPYTYEWTPSVDCFFAGSSNAGITNLFECVYEVTVTDFTGCQVTESIFLDAPQVMDIFVSTSLYNGGYNISCPDGNDGQISVSVSGGTPDCTGFAPECYEYDWATCDPVNVPGSAFQDGLIAGTYCVVVTDANGCVATTQIPIGDPEPIEASGVISDYNGFGVSCNGVCDGFITPNITGGTDEYVVYEWITGDIGDNDPEAITLVDLCAGVYELRVVDTNDCENIISFELTEPAPMEVTVDNVNNVTCYLGIDGSISVTATGGTEPYDYDWNNGAFNGNVLVNLTGNTYNLVVTDDNGCTVEETVIVTQPGPFTVTLTVPVLEGTPFDIPCNGENSGSINTVIQGGTPNYFINWSGPGVVMPTAQNQTNLTAGTYTIIVTDNNGCTTGGSVTLTEPSEPLLITSDVSLYPNGLQISCFGACDGFVDLTVSGGVEPYTFLWEINNNGGEFALTEDIADVCAGHYEVLVSDANGCSELLIFDLLQPDPIVITPTLSDYNGFNFSCPTACDGEVTIDVTGGEAPVIIEWFIDNISVGGGLSQTDLCPGQTVSVTATDALGCTTTLEIILTAPEEIVFNETVSQITCFGEVDGSIVTNVTGGTGSYTYTWTPDFGNVTEISGLGEGQYCLDIEDTNGCTASMCWDIVEPASIAATLSSTDAGCGLCDGTATLVISGGTEPYQIEWQGTTAIADDQVSAADLCEGVYTATVTDAGGCSVTVSTTIDGQLAMVLNLVATSPLCFGDCDGSIDATVTNGTAPLTIAWVDASGAVISNDEDLSELCNGTFTLTVTSADGCEVSGSATIAEPTSITINAEITEYENGYNVSVLNGTDGEVVTSVAGGTPTYEYVWSGGATAVPDGTESPNNLGAGTYQLMIKDANGCMVDTTIIITGPEDLTLPTGLSPNGDNQNDFYVILGIDGYPVNTFKVFNRWGNLVYDKANYNNEWFGQNNSGEPLPDGTYFVVFEAGSRQFGTYVDLRR